MTRRELEALLEQVILARHEVALALAAAAYPEKELSDALNSLTLMERKLRLRLEVHR